MARLELYDTEPQFGVERTASGDVELQIRASGVAITVNVGDLSPDVSLLGESLQHLAENTAEIVDGWPDTPAEHDAYITVDRGRYHVSLDGSRVSDYPSRQVAEIELARAMVASGVFPNAWFITDHGNDVAIDDDVRRWHDGDRMATVPGVQYQTGDRVRYADDEWPYHVIGDWGPAGVEIHANGYLPIRCHVTDRDQLRPDPT